MALLSKGELLGRVLTAIRASGWLPLVESDDHPFDLVAVRGGERAPMRVYIWNVTSGGPSRVRREGERRIQLTGVQSPLEIPAERSTLLLGWDGTLGAFYAFDPARHTSFKWSTSIQVPRELPGRLDQGSLATGTRANAEVVVGFLPTELMGYVVAQSHFHMLADPEPGLAAMRDAVEDADIIDVPWSPPPQRSAATVELTRWIRDSSFRDRVMAAYNARCAVCGLNVGLPDAAHIVPVSVEGSTDETCNGLALCPTHHVAYDRGLMGISPEYVVFVGSALSVGAGDDISLSEQILHWDQSRIMIPAAPPDRPDPGYLARGLDLRGLVA